MVKFIDIDSSDPYKEFLNFYELALKSGQDNIEAISVSSYSKEHDEVRSRFVNLKYIKNDQWVFLLIMIHLKMRNFRIIIKLVVLFLE